MEKILKVVVFNIIISIGICFIIEQKLLGVVGRSDESFIAKEILKEMIGKKRIEKKMKKEDLIILLKTME